VVSNRRPSLTPVDTIFADIRDAVGFEDDCRRARNLGFAGKMAILPSQVGTICLHFSPTRKELDGGTRQVVEAFDRAEAEGLAAIIVDGKLVHYPIAVPEAGAPRSWSGARHQLARSPGGSVTIRRRPSVSRVLEGAADKATTQLVRVQPCQLSVSDMKQRHIPGRVTVRAMRGVKGLAARRLWTPRSEPPEGRASLGARR
jgi:hypothetical protein